METKMDKGRVSVDGIDLDRAVRTDGHGFGLGKVNLVEQEIVIVVIKVVVVIVVVAGRGRRRRREEGGEGWVVCEGEEEVDKEVLGQVPDVDPAVADGTHPPVDHAVHAEVRDEIKASQVCAGNATDRNPHPLHGERAEERDGDRARLEPERDRVKDQLGDERKGGRVLKGRRVEEDGRGNHVGCPSPDGQDNKLVGTHASSCRDGNAVGTLEVRKEVELSGVLGRINSQRGPGTERHSDPGVGGPCVGVRLVAAMKGSEHNSVDGIAPCLDCGLVGSTKDGQRVDGLDHQIKGEVGRRRGCPDVVDAAGAPERRADGRVKDGRLHVPVCGRVAHADNLEDSLEVGRRDLRGGDRDVEVESRIRTPASKVYLPSQRS